MDVIQKTRWLDRCRHKKSMEFITIESLRASGQISETEVQLFKGQIFPRRELIGMTRHRDYDKNDWLIRTERWFGLTPTAVVVTISVSNIDFTRRIHFEPDMVPIDPSQPEGPTARIVKIGTCLPGYETAEKIYLTPFTKENVLAAMQKAQRFEDMHGRLNLAFSKAGSSNEASISDLDSFINGDLEALFKQQMTPQPTINIDSHKFLNYIKSEEGSKEKHTQYT